VLDYHEYLVYLQSHLEHQNPRYPMIYKFYLNKINF
jgi:hypothetical protein